MSVALEATPVVSGKYALHRLIGTGGAASVYEAENLLVGKRVALKRLSPALARVPALCSAFLAEARVAARVGHPNIADILDIGIDRDGLPYIVMELIEGETLEQIIARRGPLPVPYACELMLQVLAAVDAAHAAGIVHRDLKPANVIVAHPHPDQPKVKVLDFGIAQGLVEAEGQQVASIRWAGTPLYMAPEQALGLEVDARADVYSASVMLYELLTGALPYETSSIDELLARSLGGKRVPILSRLPSLPRSLAEAIEAGLAGKRDQRLGSVRELADVLAAYVAPVRRVSFRALDIPSGEPIPLTGRKQHESWQVIGLSRASSESALRNPRIPSPPPTPRRIDIVAEEPLGDEPAPRSKQSRWRPALALVLGFALGLAATYAFGLLS
jgi:serine/threonine-protein kinase